MKLNTHAVSLDRTRFIQEDKVIKDQFTSYLANMNCLLDCRFVYTVLYYHLPKFHVHYKFYEIYRVKKDQDFHSHLIMFGSNIYRNWISPPKRHFHGNQLKAATVVSHETILILKIIIRKKEHVQCVPKVLA